tara:strand:- start:30 stop:188 length:159 start_codon:yes stop_codon:yes gene_type:complete
MRVEMILYLKQSIYEAYGPTLRGLIVTAKVIILAANIFMTSRVMRAFFLFLI